MEAREERPSAPWGGSSRLAIAIWLRLLRWTNRKGQELGEQLRAWDLSPAQFDVIAQIGASEGLTQRDLAQKLIVTEGNITQLLDKMQQRGLVQRHPEGRCNRLGLTEAGRALFRAAVPAHEERVARLFDSLTDGERSELLRLVRKLQHQP